MIEMVKLLCICMTELQIAIKNDFLCLLYEIEKYDICYVKRMG